MKNITKLCMASGISKTDHVKTLLLTGAESDIKKALKLFATFKIGIPKDLGTLVGCTSEMISDPRRESFYCQSLKLKDKQEAMEKSVSSLKTFFNI